MSHLWVLDLWAYKAFLVGHCLPHVSQVWTATFMCLASIWLRTWCFCAPLYWQTKQTNSEEETLSKYCISSSCKPGGQWCRFSVGQSNSYSMVQFISVASQCLFRDLCILRAFLVLQILEHTGQKYPWLSTWYTSMWFLRLVWCWEVNSQSLQLHLPVAGSLKIFASIKAARKKLFMQG